jgi:hypothetical protein
VKYRLALTGLIMLAVAGCGLISRPVVGGPGDCPVPAADTQLLKSEEHRYCILHPREYTTEQPNPQEMIISSGSLLDVEHPRATISVRDANGRSAGEIAGGILAEVKASLPNWGVRQSTAQIGGETAIVLDNLPGQEIGRQVVLVHDNQVYTLTFVPAGPAGTDPVRQAEQLYKTVVESLRFIP